MTSATVLSAPSRPGLLGNANFRWLLSGSLISTLGDQFTLLALPWLVLQLSDDPLALGLVLAVMSVPRAIFILVGGVVVDRYAPTRVLMLGKLAQCVLLSTLSVTLYLGLLHLWMVYVFAFGLGLATAFSYPAGSALLPRCVPPDLLRPANGMLMSFGQTAALLGPIVAGAVIVFFRGNGLALAFILDAGSFAISALAVLQLKLISLPRVASGMSSVAQDLADGARAFWADVPLRTVCLYFAAIAFFVGGPISVALPVLARTQLEGGAAALGWLLASNGLGVLIGLSLSGVKPHWRLRNLGLTMLVIDAVAGLAFVPFGHITSVWQDMAVLAALGVLLGFVRVAVFSWMQKRVPPAMIGRMMSLFLFIIMGLAPLASATAGAALRVLSPASLFTVSGVALLVIVGFGFLFTPIRFVDDV